MKCTSKLADKYVKGLLSVFFITFSSFLFASSDADALTTIILINRQAELVDVSPDGEVLKRHVSVPDYFSSGRSHQNSLRRSLKLLKDYGVIDHTLPGKSKLSGLSLQSYLIEMSSKERVICVSDTQNYLSFFYETEVDLKSNTVSISYVKGQACIKSRKREKEVHTSERRRSFAEIFYPQSDLYQINIRQQKKESIRYHRGVFKDT